MLGDAAAWIETERGSEADAGTSEMTAYGTVVGCTPAESVSFAGEASDLVALRGDLANRRR